MNISLSIPELAQWLLSKEFFSTMKKENILSFMCTIKTSETRF